MRLTQKHVRSTTIRTIKIAPITIPIIVELLIPADFIGIGTSLPVRKYKVLMDLAWKLCAKLLRQFHTINEERNNCLVLLVNFCDIVKLKWELAFLNEV